MNKKKKNMNGNESVSGDGEGNDGGESKIMLFGTD